jgi:hypothetical protein
MKSLLKQILGFKRSIELPAVSPETDIEPTAQFPTFPLGQKNPKQQNIDKTEAYQNRKKGRKLHRESYEDLARLIFCIESHGEVKPGQLEQELGMSRSSLTYNLKRLLGQTKIRHTTRSILGKKRLERLGAGQSVRYRIVKVDPQIKETNSDTDQF